MFFEVVVVVLLFPSICLDKLIEEFKPFAVDWVLSCYRSTRLELLASGVCVRILGAEPGLPPVAWSSLPFA